MHEKSNSSYMADLANIQLGGDVMREGMRDSRPYYGSKSAREVNVDSAKDAMIVVRHALCLGAAMIFFFQWLF